MPDWDQWDAEALGTYVPWFTNDHFLTHLFQPHNEHRVILTKLQNLALVLLNGQWDARLQAVTNAALHAALATALWLLGLRLLATQSSGQRVASSEHHPLASQGSSTRYPLLATRYFLPPLLFLLAFALFGLPAAWQNVLGGFHSQQYWLAGLAFVTIVTFPFARAFSAAWWLGAVSGILGLGSMGSGFLAAFAVLLVVAFRLSRRESTLRAAAPTLALCLALVAIGVFTRHEVPGHADLKSKTVHDFVFTIIHSLQWPWRHQHWAALLLWLPWLLLAVQILNPKPKTQNSKPSSDAPPPASETHNPKLKTQNSSLSQTVLALGGWVLLQLAATAYARGIGADYPASRYMDTLTIGAMANALALLCLLSPSLRPSVSPSLPLSKSPRPPAPLPPSAFRLPPFLFTLTLAWLLTLALGLHNYLAHTVRWELEGAKEYYVKAEGHLRRYLATNDPKHFAHPDIPFPSAEGLIERLAIPSLRVLMPAPVRSPLPLTPASAPDATAPSNAFRANTAINADIENPPRAGLSPATPPLDYTTTWGSFATPSLSTSASTSSAAPAASSTATPSSLRWRSAPLTPTSFAYLKFEIAGDLGPTATTDVSLTLRDATNDTLLATIRPSRTPGDRWRSAYVRRPSTPFVVAAEDNSPSAWFAFSGPVEMGRLSYLAWQATKHAALIFVITLGATLALVVVSLLPARRASLP